MKICAMYNNRDSAEPAASDGSARFRAESVEHVIHSSRRHRQQRPVTFTGHLYMEAGALSCHAVRIDRRLLSRLSAARNHAVSRNRFNPLVSKLQDRSEEHEYVSTCATILSSMSFL